MDYARIGPFVNDSATPPVSAETMDHFEDTFKELYDNSIASVIHHGADRSGGSDDTAAFNACMANAFSAVVYIPKGSYNYNGTGFNANTSTNIVIIGDDPYHSVVNLGPTSRLIDIGNGTVNAIRVSNIGTNGGIGAFRSLYTGPQVSGMYLFENCQFNNYTGCCIEKNAQDWPGWTFRDCNFFGANWTTTIGIASNGLTDGLNIDNCSFPRNRISIKLGYGGNNAYINRCGFIHADANSRGATAFIWVVPQNTSSQNIGAGMVVSDCRFGSENLLPNDYYTVYADEDTSSGSTFGDRFPALSTASTGNIGSHRWRDNLWLGTDGMQGSLIFSTTPNVYSMRIDGAFSGTKPSYVLQYLNPPTAGADSAHVIGPFIGNGISTSITPGPIPSNDAGPMALIDPNQNLDGRLGTFMSAPGGQDPEGYVRLLGTTPQGFTLNNATKANISNGFGDTADAAQFTFGAGGFAQTSNFVTATLPGRPAFLEFSGASGTLTTVRATILNAVNAVVAEKTVTFGADWKHEAIQWTPRDATAAYTVRFDLPLGGSTGSVKIGRVYVYHNRERLNLSSTVIIGGQRMRLSLAGSNVIATAV